MGGNDLYYKTKGGHIKSVPLHTNTKRIILDYRPIETIELEPLRQCKQLSEISLKSCTLDSINLQPLQECFQITRIDLSGNRLRFIDLQPLRELKQLEYLNLASNGITDIDLRPLVGFKKLKGLILRGNGFQQLDITPLALCSQLGYLTFGPDVQIIADHLLQHYGAKMVRSKIELFKESISSAAEVINSLVESGDCSELQKILLRMLDTQTRLMERQFHILRVLGMPEFAGLDHPLFEIVKHASTNQGLESFVNDIYEQIVILVEQQVEGRGFTAFFDIEKMKRTHAARLIPKILRRREMEFEETSLYDNDSGSIDLTPLWITSFGYGILKALNLEFEVDLNAYENLKKSFKQVNLDLSVSVDASVEGVRISDEMRKFVLTRPL